MVCQVEVLSILLFIFYNTALLYSRSKTSLSTFLVITNASNVFFGHAKYSSMSAALLQTGLLFSKSCTVILFCITVIIDFVMICIYPAIRKLIFWLISLHCVFV